MKRLLDEFSDVVAYPLYTRPLATFSIIFFVFSVMRLYVPVQPLFALAFFIGTVLVLLHSCGKINGFITIFIFVATVLSICSANRFVLNTEKTMDEFDCANIHVEGTITSFPDVADRKTTFYVDADNIYADNGAVGEKVKVFVNTSGVNFEYGDKIVFNGFATKTEKTAYYLAKGAPLRVNNVTILSLRTEKSPLSLIAGAKKYVIKVGSKLTDSEARMLFNAIVAGDKTDFTDEFSNNLARSGISHIACVSGLHISLVGMGIYNLLKKKKYLATAVSIIGVILFTVLTGASPSTVRAAIMFLIYLFSKVSMRQNDSFTTLSLSAMILVIINPYVVYDWGFILSFLSVLGIELLYKDLANGLSFLPKYLADSIAVTVSAQLMTLPAITIMFGRVSVYSVFSNIIVSVVFTTTLYLSIICVFVFRIPCVNSFTLMLTEFFLKIICVISEFFSEMQYSYMGINAFSVVELVCYYIFIGLFVFRHKLRDVFFYSLIILCVLVLGFNFYSKNIKDEKYMLGDDSYIVASDDLSYLVVKEDVEYIKNDIIQWGRTFDVDFIIMTKNVKEQEDELLALKNLICAEKVYIEETYMDSEFLHFAERMNLCVERYPENMEGTEIEEYIVGIEKSDK